MLATALLCLALVDVLDVDLTQGPYFQIHEAVFAAGEGDVIRVAPGLYESFAVNSKSVTVVGVGGRFEVEGTIRIQGIAEEQTAAIQNFAVYASGATFGITHLDNPLIIGHCPGSVRVSDFAASGGSFPGGQFNVPTVGLRIIDAADVSLSRGRVEGGSIYYDIDEFQGHDAAAVTRSNVAFYNCELYGHDTLYIDFGWGGNALVGTDSDLWFSGTNLDGGHGSPSCFCSLNPGPPGMAIFQADRARLLDCTTDGLIVNVNEEIVYQGRAALLEAPHLETSGVPISLSVEGEAGDRVYAYVSSGAERRSHPANVGDLLVEPRTSTWALYGLGTIPTPSAQLVGSLPAVAIGATDVLQLNVQCIHFRNMSSAGTSRVLAEPQVVTILGSAW